MRRPPRSRHARRRVPLRPPADGGGGARRAGVFRHPARPHPSGIVRHRWQPAPRGTERGRHQRHSRRRRDRHRHPGRPAQGVRPALRRRESILDAAHRHGADLPYSCKSGVCCTCRAKIREGKVAMAENYSLEPWEVEAGYVLTCQSRPLTERVVIDFDAA
ncbi:2Fe-2S iron-sulfur cluster-binding protein [Azospirillum doebereinerae]|uniref:2Fe-2S iron-sulfur cluster-binding protein n=1 Tax=Azospirillum doebereinerae TaxID=92933 RepID=UPI003850C4B8